MDRNPSEGNPRFAVNNLVWGKIKSHPWWPGQIYDTKHASEYAIKKQINDHFLVAYFGDKTFAWVQESQLKHFEPCFNDMRNQKSMDSFVKAVKDALLEYSRQVELGLVCKCLKDEILVGLKNQTVENAGVREGTRNDGVIVSEFLPSIFLDFIQACAIFPFARVGRLELARVVGQLKAFSGYKGNNELCSICDSTAYFVENDGKTDVELSSVEPELKRSRPHGVREENEKDDGISGVDKGKRKYACKVFNESSIEVLPNSCENEAKVESSASEKKRDEPRKKRGRPRMIREVDENVEKDSISGEKVHKKEYVGKKIDNQNDSEVQIATRSAGRKKKMKFDEDIIKKSSSKSDELTEEVEDSEKGKRELKVRRKNFFNSDSNSEEFGKGKRVKITEEIMSPLSAMRAKVGDRIKQAAAKVNTSLTGEDKYEVSNKVCNSPSEMLSQLYSLVINPTSYSDIMPASIKFLTSFKNYISIHNEGKEGRKEGNSRPTSFELSEADFVQDSYWSDKVFDGCSEKAAASMETANKDVKGDSVKKTDDETPTVLILGFSEPEALPSMSDLIGKLSTYGLLKEEDTEILSSKRQARVVFKHRVDAESAYDDAGIHSLFEATPVSYRLRYSHQPLPATLPNMNTTARVNDIDLESRG